MPTVPTRKTGSNKFGNAAGDGAIGVDAGVGTGLIDSLELDHEKRKMKCQQQQKECSGAYRFQTGPMILKNRRCFERGQIEK